MKRIDGSKVMDDFIEVIKSIQMVQGTASTLVLQGAILDLAARLAALERTVKDYKEAVDAITAWADGKDRQAYEKAITEIPDNPDRAEIVERYYTRLLSVEHTRTQLTKILNDLIDEVAR